MGGGRTKPCMNIVCECGFARAESHLLQDESGFEVHTEVPKGSM